jgi:Cu-processing system permease protein
VTVPLLPVADARRPLPRPDAIPTIRRVTSGLAQPSVVATVLRHEWRSLLRNRGVLVFGVGTLTLTDIVLRLTGSAPRAMSALLNLVLLVVPLVTTMAGIISWHASREFNELLLTQPVRRRSLFTALYLSLVLPLAGAFVLGMLLPLAWHRAIDAESVMQVLATVGSGLALTFVFGGIALLIGIRVEDRLRGVMTGLMAWLLLTVGYDALVLIVATTFADYPLERPMLALMLGNPVDLARSVIVLQSDAAALMGYTGAVMSRFLGSTLGTTIAAAGLLAWILVPVQVARRSFERRDF